MQLKTLLKLTFFTYISLFITACSLQPGNYNESIRFSENSSTDFTVQWSDQALADQSVGFESGTSHPYYILFYTEDFKDLNMRNMYAKIDLSLNRAANSNLQTITLSRLSPTTWRGTFYLPATLDDTPQNEVKFHLKDAEGEYEKCSGIFFPSCSWKSVKLSDNGYDETSSDTYSDPFAIKDIPINSSNCVDKTEVLFLESSNSLTHAQTNNDCSLKTKVVGFNSDYDLYIKNDGVSTTFSTEYNISSDGVSIAGPFEVNLTSSTTSGWSVAENILATTDGTTPRASTELSAINTIRNAAYKHITFTLSGGATLTTTSTSSGSTADAQCCYEDGDGVQLDQCTDYSNTITGCPLDEDSSDAVRTLIKSAHVDMSCSESSGDWTCSVDSGSSGTVDSDNWKYFHPKPTTTTTTTTISNGAGAATSDPFSIRPDHFKFFHYNTSTPLVENLDLNAGNEFNISIKSENSANQSVTNYNTTLSRVNFYTSFTPPSGKICTEPEVDVDVLSFSNGVANAYNLSINDISDSSMALKLHLVDKDWTLIDHTGDCIANSASNSTVDGKVGCDIALTTPYAINKVTPASFAFLPMFGLSDEGAPLFILDSRDAPFTYLDDSLNQSLDINFTAQAISSKGSVLHNYDANCIAQDVNLSVGYGTTVTDDSLKLKYNYVFRKLDGTWNTNDINYTTLNRVNISMPKENFHEGTLSIGGHMNFTREITKPLNPFLFYFTSAILNDPTNNINVNYFELHADTLDPSMFMFPFLYGASQVRVSDDANNINKKIVNVDYTIFCDKECQQSNPQTFGTPKYVLNMLGNTAQRSSDALWWVSNPLHQVYETRNGVTKFKHGGIKVVNGVNENNATSSSWSSPTTITNITTVFKHDNNTTIIEATYDGTKGYPFQKSINMDVSSWLQYNRYGIADVSLRVDVRYIKEPQASEIAQEEGGVTLKVKKENSKRIHW